MTVHLEDNFCMNKVNLVPKQTFYEVFERKMPKKLKLHSFFLKVRWLNLKYFWTNYTEHNMNLKVKET